MARASDGLVWLPEKPMLAMLGLPRSTYHSWEKEGLLLRPEDGAHTPTSLTEALLTGAVREHLSVAATRNVLSELRDQGRLSAVVDRFRDRDWDRLDVVIDSTFAEVIVALDDETLLAAVRSADQVKSVHIVPLGAQLRRAINGFYRQAGPARPAPEQRRRGRPAKVVELRASGS